MIFAWIAVLTISFGVTGAQFHQETEHDNAPSEYSNITIADVNGGLHTRDTPYWYENIAHQGKSAFGPAGYQIYRNVKDYGAKGAFYTPNPKIVFANFKQAMEQPMILLLSRRL
jgi:hypothetical protein